MNSNCLIKINQPTSFVEYRRSFIISGEIISKELLKEHLLLEIKLFNSSNELVRIVNCHRKNINIYVDHHDLTTYVDSLDPQKKKLKEFGFCELVVDDIDQPNKSLRLATNKCWYSDTSFKALIVSASNIENGAIFDDGINYYDDNKNAYQVLPIGKYRIEVSLSNKDELLAQTNKEITIGKREKQAICRFNPLNHKERMIKWCYENNVSIIEDTLPGYLEPYLGKWYYHMGLLKMYRANDICLFDDVETWMFVYLIDKNSTSYATELAYLQVSKLIDKRLKAYHYDIGEAKVLKKEAKIIEFKNDLELCRIDIVDERTKDNLYYLDERYLENSIFDLTKIRIKANQNIAIMGVIKPYQQNPCDFIFNDDNTYINTNEPQKIRYYFNDDIIEKEIGLTRIDNEDIGSSVYEFYHVFKIKNNDKIINLKMVAYDAKDNIIGEVSRVIDVC